MPIERYNDVLSADNDILLKQTMAYSERVCVCFGGDLLVLPAGWEIKAADNCRLGPIDFGLKTLVATLTTLLRTQSANDFREDGTSPLPLLTSRRFRLWPNLLIIHVALFCNYSSPHHKLNIIRPIFFHFRAQGENRNRRRGTKRR